MKNAGGSKMETHIGHQGDVHIRLCEPGTRVPQNAIEVSDPDDWIVALGESSGHRHRVVGERVRFFRAPDRMMAWALIDGPAMLIHDATYAPGVRQDHDEHRLPTGLVEFRRKREATLTDAGWRPVED
jgi:hypothetical protein